MAKLTKDELKAKINEKITDEALSTEFLEDIEDSFEIAPEVDIPGLESERDTYKADAEKYKTQYEEQLRKYKERFLSGSSSTDDKDEDEDKDIIDIREI